MIVLMTFHEDRAMKTEYSFHRNATGIIILALISCISLQAQVSIEIGAAATVEITNSINLDVSGNWTNGGTFVPGSGTVTFNGSTGTQNISQGTGAFNNLTVNKASGNVHLTSSFTVNGTLTVTSGDLDLNGETLTLGSSATVSETAGNTVMGSSGSITTTRSINAPSSLNVGGLGLAITSVSNLGSTTVTRTHQVRTGNGNSSIERAFEVSPANNSGLNATLVFIYDDSELNGLTENDLTLFNSTDNGTTWAGAGGSLNTTNNTVTLNGIDGFSLWTAAASSTPLPTQMAEFVVEGGARSAGGGFDAELRWKTETEVDNFGFEVERKLVRGLGFKVQGAQPETSNLIPAHAGIETQWSKAGFVKGSGTSTSPKEYSSLDCQLPPGRYAYRIKQIDNNGSARHTDVVEVEVGLAPREFTLSQNYPNPFNPTTTIEFTLPEDGPVKLDIFDIRGRLVTTLLDENLAAGIYHHVLFDAGALPSGIYFSRVAFGNSSRIRKLTFIK